MPLETTGQPVCGLSGGESAVCVCMCLCVYVHGSYRIGRVSWWTLVWQVQLGLDPLNSFPGFLLGSLALPSLPGAWRPWVALTGSSSLGWASAVGPDP